MASARDSIAEQLALPPSNYARGAFQVTEYDCMGRTPLRSAMLLGGVPKAVAAAASRGTMAASRAAEGGEWPVTKWNAKDSATLKDYYGPKWKHILTPNVSFVQTYNRQGARAHGGAEGDEFDYSGKYGGDEYGGDEYGDDEYDGSGGEYDGGGDEYDGGGDEDVDEDVFGDLSGLNALALGTDEDDDGAVLIAEGDLQSRASRRDQRAVRDDEAALSEDAATTYSTLGVSNIDTVADLRQRVYLAMGIPPYRQHLFWENENFPLSAPLGAYVLSVGGMPQRVDIRRFGADEALQIEDVPVSNDLSTELERGNVFVEGVESFIQLRQAGGGQPLSRMFVVDLERVVAPRRRALIAAAEDRLRANLLYQGMAIKYWPLMSKEAFLMYLRDPASVAQEYPRLAFGGLSLGSRAELERSVQADNEIMRTVEARADAALRRYATPGSVAITSATLTVDPRRVVRGRQVSNVILDVSKLFNLFSTSRHRPAIVGRFYITSTGRSRQDITVVKKHITAELGGNDDAVDIDRICRRSLRRHSMVILIRTTVDEGSEEDDASGLIDGAWLRGRARLLVMSIQSNGEYSVEASWSEDARMSPEAVVREVGGMVLPIIEEINRMGSMVFSTNGRLYSNFGDSAGGAGSARVSLEGMTTSFFWPASLTEEGFRRLKSRWRGYEQAGAVNIKGLQQAGAFAFQLRKGVTAYDPRAIERTVVVSRRTDSQGRQRQVREVADRTQNTYSYLTDDTIAARWECIYGGRPVRIFHRTTDLRVEVVGSNEEELRIAWNILFTFFESLAQGPDKLPPGLLSTGKGRTVSKSKAGLKALQDSDPNLFDLRRSDRKATVYSVLCQKPRPPVAYSPDEIDTLPAKVRAKLVQYWNFTENRPAYYHCASPKFPHLSFLDGRHPDGYCLPCCQKTTAHPGSRRDLINQRCLQAYANGPDETIADLIDDVEVSSRHTLAYGKRVPPGRVATLAPEVEEGLLYQARSTEAGGCSIPKAEYRLLGVSQSLPSLPEGGMFYAVAGAIGRDPDDMAQTFAAAVEKLGSDYEILVEGNMGHLFSSAGELAAAIIDTFTAGDSAVKFTAFSPGGRAHEFWIPLVLELASTVLDVYPIIFRDPDGSARGIMVDFPRQTLSWLRRYRNSTKMAGQAVIVFDVGRPESKRSSGGVYPLVQVKRGMDPAGTWAPCCFVVGVLREMGNRENKRMSAWAANDLAILLATKRMSAYSVVLELVGLRGESYAVILKGAKGHVYVPFEMSTPGVFGSPQTAGSLDPKMLGTARATVQFLEDLSYSCKGVGAAANIEYELVHTEEGRRAIGFQVGVATTDAAGVYAHLNFYHQPVKAGAAARPTIEFPILPWEIDAMVGDASADDWASIPITDRGRDEMYRQVTYRLFLTEFMTHMLADRNEAAREKLRAAAKGDKTPAKKRADIAAVLRPLVSKNYTEEHLEDDVDQLTGALTAVSASSRGVKKSAAANLAAAMEKVYNFDTTRLYAIRDSEPGWAEAEIGKIMKSIVEVVPAEKLAPVIANIEDLNIYASCKVRAQAGVPGPPCAGERLIVSDRDFPEMVSILAHDVRNPMVADTLPLALSGILDDMSFVRRPGETILVHV